MNIQVKFFKENGKLNYQEVFRYYENIYDTDKIIKRIEQLYPQSKTSDYIFEADSGGSYNCRLIKNQKL